MQKNQNLKVSKIYKTLSFSLLLGLTTTAGRAFGQEWSDKVMERVEYMNTQVDIDEVFFNEVIAASRDGILIRDLYTNQERIIKAGEHGIVWADAVKAHKPLAPNDIGKMFYPGDKVLVRVHVDNMPGNVLRPWGNKIKVSPEEYYSINKVLSANFVIVYVADKQFCLARKGKYNPENANFETLKGQIMTGVHSR